MQKEQIQEFTRRITQSNRTELILVTYEILFAYLTEAKLALEESNWDDYKQALRQAQKCIKELMNALNFSYGLAAELHRTYIYCQELLATAVYKRTKTEIEESEALLHMLYIGFQKVAETDHSAPLMRNTEQVYAGYTYGRNDVNESSLNSAVNRGFLV